MDEHQSPNELSSVVHAVIGQLAPSSRSQSDDSDHLIEDLEYHSLALIEMSFVLEELFSLAPITPEAAATIQTAGDIRKYVEEAILSGLGDMPQKIGRAHV